MIAAVQWAPVAAALGFVVGMGLVLYADELRIAVVVLVIGAAVIAGGDRRLLDDPVAVAWDDLDDLCANGAPQTFAEPGGSALTNESGRTA